jgi:heptosyltransferase-1
MASPERPTALARPIPTARGPRAALARGETNLRPPGADRILIIRLGALGDVVRTLPAALGLRSLYPGAHLTWLVEPGAAGVVDAAGIVDETMVFPRHELVEFLRGADGLSLLRKSIEVVRRLRDRRFDLVLDFHGILKSGLLARISGAPIRYGYGRSMTRESSSLFVNRHVDLEDAHVSRYDRNAALVEALSPTVKMPGRPFLHPSPLAVARLAARLRISRREDARGFVLIHPGSSPGARHKRYAPAAWGEIAQRLVGEGIEVWVASGPDRHERKLVEEVVRRSGGLALPAPETRSFDDLLALLGRASIFVSGDSGPLHAASLAGTPVLQLLGPTDPIHNEPWRSSPSRRVHVPLPCSPCRRGCAEAACMRAIPPGLVVEEICRLREAFIPAGTQASELPQ